MKEEDVLSEVQDLMITLFDLNKDDITLEAKLYEDLELDSIDAVDMIVHLQKKIGQKIKPEIFKSVRTVGDVVDIVTSLIQASDEQ